MRVRELTNTDVGVALELARRIHAEGRFSRYPLNEGKLQGAIESLVADESGAYCCFLAESANGTLAGMCYGVAREFFFADTVVADSLVFWVAPEWRGSSAGPKLVLAFRRWAANRGAVEINIGVASGARLGQTDRFMKRLGFRLTGGNYSLALEPAG